MVKFIVGFVPEGNILANSFAQANNGACVAAS